MNYLIIVLCILIMVVLYYGFATKSSSGNLQKVQTAFEENTVEALYITESQHNTALTLETPIAHSFMIYIDKADISNALPHETNIVERGDYASSSGLIICYREIDDTLVVKEGTNGSENWGVSIEIPLNKWVYYVVRLSKGDDDSGVCEIYEDGYLKQSFSVPVSIKQLYNQPIYVGHGTNEETKHIYIANYKYSSSDVKASTIQNAHQANVNKYSNSRDEYGFKFDIKKTTPSDYKSTLAKITF